MPDTENPGVTIRNMEQSDLAAVANIEQRVSPHPWRESQFQESLLRHHCLVVVGSDQLIGYAVFSTVLDEAEILNIAITEDMHGQGYGRLLIDHLISRVAEKAKRLFLEVRASNFAAIHLYQNSGFVEICERRNYYQTAHGSEDAIVMAMELG